MSSSISKAQLFAATDKSIVPVVNEKTLLKIQNASCMNSAIFMDMISLCNQFAGH